MEYAPSYVRSLDSTSSITSGSSSDISAFEPRLLVFPSDDCDEISQLGDRLTSKGVVIDVSVKEENSFSLSGISSAKVQKAALYVLNAKMGMLAQFRIVTVFSWLILASASGVHR